MDKQAIIIGATSGIGRAVALRLLDEGWRVAITGRRTERLAVIEERYGSDRVVVRSMDVTLPSAVESLDEILGELPTPSVLLYASGIGRQNPDLDEDMELRTVRTNCEGMVRIVDHFVNYVKRTPHYTPKRRAHIAVITSVAGTRGIGQAPAYSATKSMQSTYIQALAQLCRMQRLAITVGDIRPGFVATEILNPEKRYPMLISVERAAQHIYRALKRKRRVFIFDWRFKFVVAFWHLLPRFVWERLKVKN